ncbi:Uma2 family endonuclease [Nostoc sp. CHAB 5844]|nr:Uma2 family endonuclease [Nostoc sp. CHAB 5844]
MSVAKDLPAPEDVIFPSGDFYSDEPELESYQHLQQMLLLLKCLDWWWRDRNDFFCAGNITIYYSPRQRKSEYFRGPDFFVVLDTERKARNSWVVWEENGKYPNIIIELLSDSTAATDKGLKKEIYQDTFRTPEYYWFDPHNLEFAGFVLLAGKYQPIQPNPQGWLWSEQLNLYLGVFEGKLRFYTPEGQLIISPEEAVQEEVRRTEQERQRAEQERQRAEQERQRADRLAAKLRELNIDPDTI